MSTHDDRPDATTPIITGEPWPEPAEPDTTQPNTTQPDTSEPDTLEPTGPSWPTMTLGLVCLAVAVAVLVLQLVDLSVDWQLAGPLALAGIGALVAVVGALGLVLGRRR
ncbi:hypothetical protein [Ornithinicoccus halotolerans]|uniref:hypothetical protein n=1 Tax=Ornithinicoccus halotolerans TaxID=1748220 RepID=UPI0012951609|nr:hypothetical protein [Ornithinicoccus halotolerans]